MTDLVMYRGDDRDFALTVTKAGVPLSLTAATVVFTAREAIDSADASFSLTSADSGITIAADQMTDPGEITVHVPASATEDFTEGLTLLCDVEVTIAGKTFTWPEADADQSALIRLKVRSDVTHA